MLDAVLLGQNFLRRVKVFRIFGGLRGVPHIWHQGGEIKYPNNDIIGRVRAFG